MMSNTSEEGEREPEVSITQIKKAHNDNNLEENLSSIRTASDYMKKVEFKVPLNQLYEVEASCYDTEGADYCGLLVRIVDKTILSMNADLPYLLQVWQYGGKLVFEKPLAKPVENWNITQDKFLFQEDANVPELFLICLNQGKQPQVFKCQLPPNLTENRHQSVPTINIKKFVISRRKTMRIDSSFMEQEASGPVSSKVKPTKAKKRQKASVQVRGIDIDYSLSTTKSQIVPE